MDPLLLELPVRAHEAAALAEVIFQQIDGRRLNDDLRNRAAGRVSNLGLETIIPYMGSLQSDPIHPNCYFLAIDAVRGGIVKPHLLRIAIATAPSSGLFQKSILIGRMRPGGGREIVINTVPFGPGNQEGILTFASEVDRSFLPKPAGNAFSVEAAAEDAFAAFKSIHQDTGLNVASIDLEWHAAVLAAIRAGWREGYAVPAPPLVLQNDVDPTESVIARIGCTKLVLDVAQLDSATRKQMVSAAYDVSAKTNASMQWTWKRPDLELSWNSSSEAATAVEIRELLSGLREAGRTVQAVSTKFDANAGWSEVVEVIRSFNAAVSLSDLHPELAEIARACGGRVHCKASPAADLRDLVKTLRS